MEKLYFAISEGTTEVCPGLYVYMLAYNTSKTLPLEESCLPEGLREKLEELGWSEAAEGYCFREDDGNSKDSLIQDIKDNIPEMEYCSTLEGFF